MNDMSLDLSPSDRGMLEDLAKSALTTGDLQCHAITNPERARAQIGHSTQGYVIPYFDIKGKPIQHFRCRLFDYEPKYKQPKDTANHVYFPPHFDRTLKEGKNKFIILTEGEKKATLACKLGYPSVAIGGVDSWRTKIFTLPEGCEVQGEKILQVKMPSGGLVSEEVFSSLAVGMEDLITYLVQSQIPIFICFDTDEEGIKSQVQKAAAALAFELRFKGIAFKDIRQLILPNPDRVGKMGLDDYLMVAGPKNLDALIKANLAQRTAFPRHPVIRDYLNKRLQNPRLNRREMQQVSLAVVSELDANGIRLKSQSEGNTYFFDYTAKRLMRVKFSPDSNEMSGTHFGQYLYRRFGLGAADQRINTWIGTQFTGEEPIESVDPHRVIARKEFMHDSVTYQLGDGTFVKVDGSRAADSDNADYPGLQFFDNGELGILFEADQTTETDVPSLLDAYKALNEATPDIMPCWWGDVLNEVRLRDKDKMRILTALLFYVSPWLYRWRGTQLPMEMVLGEAGSGKSTLCELRLGILTGKPKLRNAPSDLRDWYASLQHAGGLHVTDNVAFSDKALRQRLSDEICRIVTEPHPVIEMRKLYSDADIYQIPVRTVFSVTAIQQPFLNQDILQRSITIELDKAPDIVAGTLSYDAHWMAHQIKRFGGREAWQAHHLLVLHRFFALVKTEWNPKYQAKNRLINFEQSLKLMAKVFGIDGDWIPNYLSGSNARTVIESDFAFEGLLAFTQVVRDFRDPAHRSRLWFSKDIAEWAQTHDDYQKCEVLINPRKLARYIATHKSYISEIAGLHDAGTANNLQRYKVVPLSMVKGSSLTTQAE